MVKMPWSASLARDRPTPHIRPTGRSWRNSVRRRFDHDQAVRLGDLRGDLGEVLGPRHADRDGKTEFRPDPLADRCCDLGGGTEEVRRAPDVDEGLVDRDLLHGRRDVVEDGHRGVAEALIVAEMAADKDELRTQLSGLSTRHAAADTEVLAS